MSGHSKWSTIKRKKGAEDAKRGKVFTRIGREIMIAAREGGGDENSNAKLKLAVAKAKAANMPKDNVERAIKKGTGELEGGMMEEYTFEGYGVDGIAFIVEALSDNKNRTLSEVKSAFTKSGGSLANAGAVAWQFKQKSVFTLKGDKLNYDDVFMSAADAGAEDVVSEEGTLIIYGPREAYAAIEQALTDAGFEIDEGELRWIADSETEVALDKALSNLRLMRKLEDMDDVQSVSTNMAITDAVIEAEEA